MEGIFAKKSNTGSIAAMLLGAGLVCLYLLPNSAVEKNSVNLVVHILLGGGLFLFGVFLFLWNRKAYLRLEDGVLYGKFHCFGGIYCPLTQIDFVLPQVNMLTVVLKSGKRRIISGVENSWALSRELRRQTYSPETESPAALREQAAAHQAARKKGLIALAACAALLFAYIFLAMRLTGDRELSEFTQSDWVVFWAMICLELVTVGVLFFLAQRSGGHLLPTEQLKYRLRGALILSEPLPGGNVRSVWTDGDNSERIVLCGFPGSEELYYTVQEFSGQYELQTVFTSDIFSDEAAFPWEKLDAFIDISSQLC